MLALSSCLLDKHLMLWRLEEGIPKTSKKCNPTGRHSDFETIKLQWLSKKCLQSLLPFITLQLETSADFLWIQYSRASTYALPAKYCLTQHANLLGLRYTNLADWAQTALVWPIISKQTFCLWMLLDQSTNQLPVRQAWNFLPLYFIQLQAFCHSSTCFPFQDKYMMHNSTRIGGYGLCFS